MSQLKHFIYRGIAAGIACTAFAISARAQIVTTGAATEVFMKGDFIEVGVATNGSFGTDNDCPAGYHGRSPFGAAGTALGFVADPDKDGWTVGTPPYFGDYYLPGTPQEGWDIQIDGSSYKAWRGGMVWGGTVFVFPASSSFSGTNVSYSSVPGKVESVWKGSIGSKIRITQTTSLKTDKVYFIVKVKINNDSDVTLRNVYYERTLDPDNDVEVGGTYLTDNKIVYKLPDADNRTLVTALGDKYHSFLGLGSKDCRVRPYILNGGLSPGASLDQIYNDNGTGTTGYIYQKDSLYSQDVGIGIVFKLDSLKAHDSTILSYAYVLRAEDLDSAFQDLAPLVQYNGKNYISGDTILVCKGSGPTTATINLLNAEDFQWYWSPKEGLSDTEGTSTTVTLTDNSLKVYYVTPVSYGCPMDPIKIVIKPVPTPAAPSAPSPVYYCQFETASPLTATATSGTLKFYTSATGGTPVSSITPPTNVVGKTTYYVSQQASVCESERTPIDVIIRALPVISNNTSTDPTRCAAADGTISFQTDGPGQVFTVHYDYNGDPAKPMVLSTDVAGGILIAGLKGGAYTNLYVVNQYGCKSNVIYGPINLTDPVPPGPPISNNGPVCSGSLAKLFAPTVDSVSYQWSGPDGFSSTDINPSLTMTDASAGVYTLILQKGACKYTPSTTELELAYTPKHQKYEPVTLCEQTKLEVPVNKEPSVHYEWSGNGISGVYDQNLVINPVNVSQSGLYYLKASSDNGCVTNDTVQVNVDQNVSLVINNDTSICNNDAITLHANTEAPAVEWTPADGLDNASSKAPVAAPAATTTYTVTAITQSTCPNKTASLTLTVVPAPSVQGFDTLIRMNVPFTLTPTYGPDVIQWRWVPSDSLSCGNCPNPVFNGNRNIDYLVYASNALGCTSADTVRVHVFCDGASVTMPNAFTPNGDGHNDKYYVRGHGFMVRKFAIYNRLGQEVFSKENFNPNDDQYGWDGSFNGTKISSADGFVYLLEVQCYNSNNETITLKGSFLLIR